MMNRSLGSLSPDSGFGGGCNLDFDIENAFMSDADPVMKQEEFADEVNHLFRPTVACLSGSQSPYDISDMNDVFDDQDLDVDLGDHHGLDLVAPTTVAEREESSSATAVSKKSAQLHSYSAKRNTKIFKSTAGILKGDRARRAKKLKKVKLYELNRPLENPELEKCRLNAINAKKNRERKKRELEVAEEEIQRLRDENEGLRDDLDDVRAEMAEMRAALKAAGIPVEEREE